MQDVRETEPSNEALNVASEAPAVSAAAAATDEKCPPPLEWQEVVREFHAQADAWYFDRTRYRLSGRTLGSGPPLYFLNGFCATHELYALLVWLLRDRYRCVLFDYPVGAYPRDVTLPELADDVAAVGHAIGDRTFDLFASSFGSLVALETMRRYPLRIGRAVLHGAFAHRRLSLVERLLIQACRVHPGRLRHVPFRKMVQRQNHRLWFPPFDLTRWEFLSDNTGKARLRDLARRAAIVRDADLRPHLAEIRQPVILVRTEGDGGILEECGAVLEAGLPQARVERMPLAGQYPFLTHPHRLAKIM